MTPARHSVSGRQNTKVSVFYGITSTPSGLQSTSDWGHYKTSTRRDDVLPTTSTSEGTSYVTDIGRLDNESDIDLLRGPGLDSAKVTLFFKLEPVPTEPEDGERGSDEEEEDLQFTAYPPPSHMHNVNLSIDDALKFSNLPHRRHDHTSSSLDSGELKVGKEFSSKNDFLGVLKQYNIMNEVNYPVVKSKSKKFEAKCVV
ncbi:hypothetical protein J1N35_019101 [Gossypium stocksii]|uniref:Transposase MuDR plant domain-containing protein n=1 Tax=Gossypium stocksii TaxID=47602 RepID=A0A9D3VQB4_9ROSI|nr:hypothetical protein J1N35_019101 [Gossypium stocksii]